MTTAPPKSLGDQIAEHARTHGITEEEAASLVIAERARASELAETTDPAVLLPAIRDALHLRAKIERITKTISTPPQYTLDTDHGPVPLGPSSRWATRPSEFAAAFLDNLGEMPSVPGAEKRRDLFGMIARAAEPVSVGEEATDTGWTRSALRDYLRQRPPTDDLDDALSAEYPYRDTDGRVCIFGSGFNRWANLTLHTKITPRDLGIRLRGIGAEPDKVNVGTGADRTSRQVWRLPANLDE